MPAASELTGSGSQASSLLQSWPGNQEETSGQAQYLRLPRTSGRPTGNQLGLDGAFQSVHTDEIYQSHLPKDVAQTVTALTSHLREKAATQKLRAQPLQGKAHLGI